MEGVLRRVTDSFGSEWTARQVSEHPLRMLHVWRAELGRFVCFRTKEGRTVLDVVSAGSSMRLARVERGGDIAVHAPLCTSETSSVDLTQGAALLVACSTIGDHAGSRPLRVSEFSVDRAKVCAEKLNESKGLLEDVLLPRFIKENDVAVVPPFIEQFHCAREFLREQLTAKLPGGLVWEDDVRLDKLSLHLVGAHNLHIYRENPTGAERSSDIRAIR
jgi:hypothetical protein